MLLNKGNVRTSDLKVSSKNMIAWQKAKIVEVTQKNHGWKSYTREQIAWILIVKELKCWRLQHPDIKVIMDYIMSKNFKSIVHKAIKGKTLLLAYAPEGFKKEDGKVKLMWKEDYAKLHDASIRKADSYLLLNLTDILTTK